MKFNLHLNRGQRLVLAIGLAIIIFIVVQNMLFPPQCLNALCPANDWALYKRLGIVTMASLAAMWVLKSPKHVKPDRGTEPEAGKSDTEGDKTA
jgi:hypothetical protein